MSSTRFEIRSSSLGVCVAWALVGGAGCLSQSYEVSGPELARLVELPAEERGERVRVTQQTSFDSDASLDDPTWDSSDTALLLVTEHGTHHHHGHVQVSDADADGSDADDALATAVAVAAVAATAAVTVGVTEGARFDGWVQAPADHPMLLVDADGQRRWERLETLSSGDLRGVDHAVFPDFAGDLERLERHPLDRRGFVYQLEFGAEQAPFEGGALAVSGRGALGFMPTQSFGVLFGAAFSTAQQNEPALSGRPGSTLSFDHRLFLQLEGWPLRAGRWHVGPYAEVGYAWALADGPPAELGADGPMLALGAALQFDWTTRLALTLRAGAAWLPSVDAGSALAASDGYRLAPSLTLGVSIY
jgi:hypothetical protein